jgi:hypothetical protein
MAHRGDDGVVLVGIHLNGLGTEKRREFLRCGQGLFGGLRKRHHRAAGPLEKIRRGVGDAAVFFSRHGVEPHVTAPPGSAEQLSRLHLGAGEIHHDPGSLKGSIEPGPAIRRNRFRRSAGALQGPDDSPPPAAHGNGKDENIHTAQHVLQMFRHMGDTLSTPRPAPPDPHPIRKPAARLRSPEAQRKRSTQKSNPRIPTCACFIRIAVSSLRSRSLADAPLRSLRRASSRPLSGARPRRSLSASSDRSRGHRRRRGISPHPGRRSFQAVRPENTPPEGGEHSLDLPMSVANWAGLRDWGPSESALSGSECTSTMRPSAPAARAARDMGATRCRCPVP